MEQVLLRHLSVGEEVEVGCIITTKENVRAYNRTYRHRDITTNILSFPTGMPVQMTPRLLGDVVVAWELVRSESLEQGVAPMHHLAHLIVHGTLHLLGYDHDDDVAYAKMVREEGKILKSLRVPNPHEAVH